MFMIGVTGKDVNSSEEPQSLSEQTLLLNIGVTNSSVMK